MWNLFFKSILGPEIHKTHNQKRKRKIAHFPLQWFRHTHCRSHQACQIRKKKRNYKGHESCSPNRLIFGDRRRTKQQGRFPIHLIVIQRIKWLYAKNIFNHWVLFFLCLLMSFLLNNSPTKFLKFFTSFTKNNQPGVFCYKIRFCRNQPSRLSLQCFWV